MSPPEDWRPTAATTMLRARARLLGGIRDFFHERGVMEVETPLLSKAGNTDPELQLIRTNEGGYLRTSPEFALKRLLAANSGDVFELGRVFRAGESGRAHNPEFTMLEWYRIGFSYHELMGEVAELVRYCSGDKFDRWGMEKVTYRELFERHLGLDPFEAERDSLARIAMKHGIDATEMGRRQWLDLLMGMVIQPGLPEQQLTFVLDYPAEQAALARVRQSSPPVAERFELYLGRVELANGYQELTDSIEQARRFEAEIALRTQRGLDVCRTDEHLVTALEHGLPECAGVALGVDRLLMAICGVDDISEVIAFPFSRA